MDDLGGRLRRVRELLALQQVDVARASVGPDATAKQIRDVGNYISRIERGIETNPSLELLERIARGCRLTLSELFTYLERADGVTLPVTGVREHDASTSAVADGARTHELGSLSPPDSDALDVLEDFVLELSSSLTKALSDIHAAKARRSPTGTDPD